MYLRDLWASCLRRWPLLLLCGALTAGAVLYAATKIEPTYETDASVVLVPPASKEDPDANRYLGLGGLKQSADVLSRSVMSEEISAEIEDAAPGATYFVEPDWATSAPILLVTTEGPTSKAAADMLDAVLARTPVVLQDLQESVDIKPRNQITQVLVSRSAQPDPVEKARFRLLGVIGAGMLVLSALLLGAVDGLLLRRSSRRKALAAEPDEPGPTAEAAPEAVPAEVRPQRRSGRRPNRSPSRGGAKAGSAKTEPAKTPATSGSKGSGTNGETREVNGDPAGAGGRGSSSRSSSRR